MTEIQTLSTSEILTVTELIIDCGIGKKIQTDIYVHSSIVEKILPSVTIKRFFSSHHCDSNDIILKISKNNKNIITFLHYPDFFILPHPHLCCSITIEPDVQPKNRTWKGPNYPILHRKELFISPKHTKYKIFANLTSREVELGLLEEPSKIGWSKNWEKKLNDAGIIFNGHEIQISGNEHSTAQNRS